MSYTMTYLLRRNDGTSLIEIALITPVLLILLAGIVDFGRIYYTMIELDTAAQAGALYGAQNALDTVGITKVTQLNATDISMNAPTISNSSCECYDGTGIASCGEPTDTCTANGNVGNVLRVVSVTTTAPFSPFFPYPGISLPSTLTAQAQMRAAF